MPRPRKKRPAPARKPYRVNVAAVVLNPAGKILTGWKHGTWQLPQGGVVAGETFRAAVLRELREEIGTDKFRVLAASRRLYSYDWPAAKTVSRRKRAYRGQRQRYFLVRFTGTRKDLHPELHGEFKALRWLTVRQVLAHAWSIKRLVYEQALREFGLLPARRSAV